MCGLLYFDGRFQPFDYASSHGYVSPQGHFYFLSLANLFDVLLIAGHWIIFGLYAARGDAYEDLQLRVKDQYVDLRQVQVVATPFKHGSYACISSYFI